MSTKIYAVRVCCDPSTGYLDIDIVRKHWDGKVLVRKSDEVYQVYDMIPPADFVDGTKEWAEMLAEFVRDELGYNAEVVEALSLN